METAGSPRRWEGQLCHESSCERQAHLWELQDRPPQRTHLRHLLVQSTAQAAPGL